VAGGDYNGRSRNNTVVGNEPGATVVQTLAVGDGIIERAQLRIEYIGGKGMDTMTVCATFL
jgi:hypothetical protein